MCSLYIVCVILDVIFFGVILIEIKFIVENFYKCNFKFWGEWFFFIFWEWGFFGIRCEDGISNWWVESYVKWWFRSLGIE